jgi:dTDP-4-amino-4,6-dideoxygalactose transaminase
MQSPTSNKLDLRVPFLDLSLSNGPVASSILDDIEELIASSAFTNGPQVASFERAFADFVDVDHCVGVASGLDALRLALVAFGGQTRDEVIVPAHTFVATLEAVTQAGCRPVIVDIAEDDLNIDPDAVAAAVTPSTRFVLPVHLYGQMADMHALLQLARKADLAVIEDACQAHGATRGGLRAGASGDAAAFSFYPGKNLGAFGDAGALTTGDAAVAAGVRALREHGQSRKYKHDREGYTARLDTIQAIVLSRKLALLDAWNDERRSAASFYTSALEGVGDLELPPVASGSNPVWHLFVIRTDSRDAVATFLAGRGIATGLHYPYPAHLTDAYAHLGYRPGAFPVAERTAARNLSLPMFPGITEPQLTAVVEAVRAYFDGD